MKLEVIHRHLQVSLRKRNTFLKVLRRKLRDGGLSASFQPWER